MKKKATKIWSFQLTVNKKEMGNGHCQLLPYYVNFLSYSINLICSFWHYHELI
jgi:hypothetical protein